MAQSTTIMAGQWELSIGSTLIPASLLGEITIDYEEGTSEADTQAGKIVTPSGKVETAEATFTLFLPSIDYLKNVYADLYNDPTSASQEKGNIIFGSNSCSVQSPVKVNIHPVCETTDDNDFNFEALIIHKFNPTLSTSDPVSIETTMYLQPTETQGRLRIGTGDLSQPSKWDVATQTTVPVQVSA